MINGEVSGSEDLERRLNLGVLTVRQALTKAVQEATIKLSSRVKEKLSGEVLKNRTGRLRRSVTKRIIGGGTDEVVGVVGTNVEYAGVHEYGFKGVVTVKEHLRVQKMAWGKAMKNPRSVTVKTHTMKMNMPERSFLRYSLAEMSDELNAKIEQAVKKAAHDAVSK